MGVHGSARSTAIVLVGVLTLWVGGTAAASAESRLAMAEEATLRAEGAAVDIFVEVTCGSPSFSSANGPGGPAEGEGSLSVEISQRVGDWVTRGFGSAEGFVCDGTSEEVVVPVTAGERPFHRGVAFAAGIVNFCQAERCESVREAKEIVVEHG